jgi:hypothetical protein
MIPVTVQNNFSGGQVTVDGVNRSSPYSTQWSLNTIHSVAAISPQSIGSANYVWCAWSSGRSQSYNYSVDGNAYSWSDQADFLGTWISGPGALAKRQTGTYDSNPSGGSSNWSYQWYKWYSSGPIYTLGTNRTQQVTMIDQSFTLKVEVTDNVYSKTAAATKYVIYGIEMGGSEPGIQEDSESSAVEDMTKPVLASYPNPFNPVTKISFSISFPGQVSLKVYDMLGRGVRVLVEGFMASGKHEVSFDASTLPSGIYLYKLQAGSETLVQKMVLLR